MILSAGMVDLQVNGFSGIDFNVESISSEDMDTALYSMLRTGVTCCLPTFITASFEVLEKRFLALDAAISQSKLGPMMVPGYHLEGPFLNPGDGYAGCHPPQDMRAASIKFVEELESKLDRPILYVTVAPEQDDTIEFIEWAVSKGKIVGAGHTGMSYDVLQKAMAAGIHMTTHLGNGAPQMLPKLDNVILNQLAEDDLKASFIADGFHIPKNILKMFIRTKTIDQSILVTDAVTCTGAEPGIYKVAGMEVELSEEGFVQVPGSKYLAGAALMMHNAVKNVVNWDIVSFEEAIQMASANPLALLMPAMKAHGISMDASVGELGEVEWDRDINPVKVRLGELEVNC